MNGLFRPFALVGGKAAATWSLSGGQLTLTPFAPLAAADEAALLADADDVLRFLGLPPLPPARTAGRAQPRMRSTASMSTPMRSSKRPSGSPKISGPACSTSGV